MQRHFSQVSTQRAHHPEASKKESVSFLQTGSSWLKEITIDSICNWSLIHQLTTELIMNIVTHSQEDPTTLGNRIRLLGLLSSTDEYGRKISGLGGVEKIITILPRPFPKKKGDHALYSSWTQINVNLRLTLRTLRLLTEPDINLHHPRTGIGANLKGVLGTLQAWGRNDTTQGLTLQVLHNLMREADEAHDTAQQRPLPRPLPRPDIRTGETRGTTGACYAHLDTHIDAHLHSTVEDQVEPGPFTQTQNILNGLKTDTHTIETVIQNLLI